MSFSMTIEAYRNRTKTVTRRLGWSFLKPGDVLMGVEKCQGIKKGEHVKKIHPLCVLSTESEPLYDIVRRPMRLSRVHKINLFETVSEGFPTLTPVDFVKMFCSSNNLMGFGCWETPVTRIEFEHLEDVPEAH